GRRGRVRRGTRPSRPTRRPRVRRARWTGVLPAGVLRDDPPPPHPGWLFRADGHEFRRTLTRLPAAAPWLRRIIDDLARYPRHDLF
ncbi:hypothetical protein ACFW15_27485, partial [Streptomyces sp. NPDC058953]